MKVWLSRDTRDILTKKAKEENIKPSKLIREIIKQWTVEERQNKHTIKLLRNGIFQDIKVRHRCSVCGTITGFSRTNNPEIIVCTKCGTKYQIKLFEINGEKQI